MAGSILGPDQIKKLNAAFPALLKHLRELLAADSSPYGLMKVHCAVEALDTTELHAIFSQLTFISPTEKRALVRAAVYEVLSAKHRAYFVGDIDEAALAFAANKPGNIVVEDAPLKTFTPAGFKLNPATTEALKEEKAPVAPAPEAEVAKLAPFVVGSISTRIEKGNEEIKDAKAKRDAAVAALRRASEPAPIVAPVVAADKQLTVVPETMTEAELLEAADIAVASTPNPDTLGK